MAEPLAVHWAAVTFCWRVLAISVRGPPVTARVRTDAGSRLWLRRRGHLIPSAKHRRGRVALAGARGGAVRPPRGTRAPIFGRRTNVARPATAETGGATRLWRIHAETF